ncbi:hypothetical protein BDP81DRAFT_54041 [Colletotrichum phormii]|uniref:Uncharacterized protein n=1 Tax=Colletotrichum phormii TaxID=359342 RepID=A0AAJ0EDM4_9PEZI|nr:uncharacterized protein BDP81DRAFT_54041 [Colletotrichum phormii]KAK1634868.1 hypothetical protein BDP81DRAFT_54041 [Colletotrichum phormii]
MAETAAMSSKQLGARPNETKQNRRGGDNKKSRKVYRVSCTYASTASLSLYPAFFRYYSEACSQHSIPSSKSNSPVGGLVFHQLPLPSPPRQHRVDAQSSSSYQTAQRNAAQRRVAAHDRLRGFAANSTARSTPCEAEDDDEKLGKRMRGGQDRRKTEAATTRATTLFFSWTHPLCSSVACTGQLNELGVHRLLGGRRRRHCACSSSAPVWLWPCCPKLLSWFGCGLRESRDAIGRFQESVTMRRRTVSAIGQCASRQEGRGRR